MKIKRTKVNGKYTVSLRNVIKSPDNKSFGETLVVVTGGSIKDLESNMKQLIASMRLSLSKFESDNKDLDERHFE